MNKKIRALLTAVCAIAVVSTAAVSAYYAIDSDPARLIFGEWLAPVNINIEIDNKSFTGDFSVVSMPMERYYYLSPTSAPGGEKIVIHTALRSSGLHRAIFLRLPEEYAENALAAIDNISVFIGNKVYYFTKNEAAKFEKSEKDGYALFRFPEMHYAKSLVIKDWVNYYGDLNIALKLLCAFFFSPNRFIAPWLFICAIFFLYRKELFQKYNALRGKKYTAAILLAGITIFAFLLRINGFARHSAWFDELYSAALASNPDAPFLSVFMDDGNPPGYFLLLKYWFKLIGYNEDAGRLLSVLLGTLACPALYLFLKKSIDKKTALVAAFFMAIAGFAVEYSQEMRAYILNMALIPFISFLFLRIVKKCSLLNLALYIIPCMVIVNAHYYGILFVMANFIFYCGYCFIKKTAVKNIFKFLAVNIIIAASFMPFFIYKLFIDRYDFSRSDCVIQLDHVIIFVVFAVFGILAFIHRGKISSVSFVADNKKTGWAYIFCITVLIFMLSFLISIAKPMIRYHYLLLTTCPFLLAVAAAVIAALPKNKTGIAAQIILCLLMGNALYWGKSDIPGGRYDFYRECYRFITLDTEAHSGQNAAMIDNAPRLAAYYHEPLLPLYASENTYDVVYGFQQGFESGEKTMYDAFSDAGLSGSSTLKIIPNANGKIVIFKTLP